MQNFGKVMFIIISFSLLNNELFGQNRDESFYDKYLKPNFFETNFTEIKSYSFEAYERGYMGKIIKSSDSIIVYASKPNYSRTKYTTSSDKRTYCYNGNEILKISTDAGFKPKIVPFAVDSPFQQATLSMFLNGFVSRNSIISANMVEKFEIISDSTIIDNKRYFKLTQKLNNEIDFEYFIEYETLFLFRENTIRNGITSTQIDYSDYRKINGIYFPFKKSEKGYENGINLERTVLKFTLNLVFPNDFFNCL
jgi:hypothetical protein